MNSKREVYQKLLDRMSTGAILTAGEIHEDIPTIHSLPGKYHSSVRHLGFGVFTGKTENGEFQFDGGGAMRRESAPENEYFLSWCPLTASPEVLDNLGYDKAQVTAALKGLIVGEA